MARRLGGLQGYLRPGLNGLPTGRNWSRAKLGSPDLFNQNLCLSLNKVEMCKMHKNVFPATYFKSVIEFYKPD